MQARAPHRARRGVREHVEAAVREQRELVEREQFGEERSIAIHNLEI